MLQQILRNPEMRRMMFSPEMMRMQLQMQRQMNQTGGSSFPAPGATDNTPQPSATATGGGTTATPNQPDTTGATDPWAAFGGAGGAGGAQPNPFANIFAGGANPAPAPTNANAPPTQNQQDPSAANPFGNLFGGPQGQQANPIAEAARNMMQNPEAMRHMMQMMGGNAGANPFGQAPAAGSLGATGAVDPAAAANPFAALFGPGGGFNPGGGFGAPSAPVDNRPPEEIYQSQLAQLNEMGFYEFDRNVSALRRSGGNVQGAIEHLLNGGA
jgi:ubiquilin